MQGIASASAESDGRNDSYNSIVSDLASLIERVQTSLTLIESAIASEAFLGNEEIAANVVVLDDVTPGYVTASAALNTCNAGLVAALHCLLDRGTWGRGTGGSDESDRRPARLTGCA